jgi:predicted nucleic acid-binding protein
MIAVVDTSAVLRLFIPDGPGPDGLEAFFRGVESGANLAIAPELLLVEAINVAVKKQRRGELTTEESKDLVGLLKQMPIRYYAHTPYCSRAYDLSLESGLSAYDAVFLALALDRGVRLFTADQQLEVVASRKGIGLPSGQG